VEFLRCPGSAVRYRREGRVVTRLDPSPTKDDA
jgi:hypothetical protein